MSVCVWGGAENVRAQPVPPHLSPVCAHTAVSDVLKDCPSTLVPILRRAHVIPNERPTHEAREIHREHFFYALIHLRLLGGCAGLGEQNKVRL